MMSRSSIAVLFLLLLSAIPSLADTDESVVNPYGVMVTAVGTSLTAFNAVAWKSDGSKTMGIAGIVVGSLQAGLGIAADTDDYGSFGLISAAVGVLGVITGVGSLTRSQSEQELKTSLRVSQSVAIEPSIRSFDGERWVGLQLSSSW